MGHYRFDGPICLEWLPGGQWRVACARSHETYVTRVENLCHAVESKIYIAGLENRLDLNGSLGIVEEWVGLRKRCVVRLQDGARVSVEPIRLFSFRVLVRQHVALNRTPLLTPLRFFPNDRVRFVGANGMSHTGVCQT